MMILRIAMVSIERGRREEEMIPRIVMVSLGRGSPEEEMILSLMRG
jgi:hypothetical protein